MAIQMLSLSQPCGNRSAALYILARRRCATRSWLWEGVRRESVRRKSWSGPAC